MPPPCTTLYTCDTDASKLASHLEINKAICLSDLRQNMAKLLNRLCETELVTLLACLLAWPPFSVLISFSGWAGCDGNFGDKRSHCTLMLIHMFCNTSNAKLHDSI